MTEPLSVTAEPAAEQPTAEPDSLGNLTERCGTEPPAAGMPTPSITDAVMDVVDRLGHEAGSVDPRAWEHLRVYIPPALPELLNTPTHEPQAGDPSEKHLTLLMCRHGLNSVIGRGRQDLLAYGRAVWSAALASPYRAQLSLPPDHAVVQFLAVNPLEPTSHAVAPLIADSWRFGFTSHGPGKAMTFGFQDNGPYVAWDAALASVQPVSAPAWREAVEFACHQLEKQRVWAGMQWHYNPIPPFQYKPALEKLRALLAAHPVAPAPSADSEERL